VVDRDAELTLVAALNNKLLNGTSSRVERSREGSEINDKVKLNSLVDLRKLLEQTSKNNIVQGLEVRLVLRNLGNSSDDGVKSALDAKRVEVNFQDSVERVDLRANVVQNILGKSLLKKRLSGRVLGKIKKRSETGVASSQIILLEATSQLRLGEGGDSKSRNEQRGSNTSKVLLLAVASLKHKGKVLAPGSGMEKVVVGNKENASQVLVVVSHHNRLNGTLGVVKQSVNILDGSKGLLPQFELNSDVELAKAGIEVSLKSVGIRKVNGVGGSRVTRLSRNRVQVNTQKLTQTTELSLSSVLNAELKSMSNSILVQNLQKRVSTKNLKGSTVSLPKKLEPRSNELSIGSVLALLARDSGQKYVLGVLSSLQILINIKSDLVSLGLSFSHLSLRKLNELLDSNF